ncbi:MAG TPA: hypothetical protein VFI38_14645 [Candidatus Acidoferrum sp.]|nr:hypothetical protein [Candidatus Acidoferrum sp.]
MIKITLFFLSNIFLLHVVAAQQPADPCEALKRGLQALESRARDWPNLPSIARRTKNWDFRRKANRG